ncbi:MAG TPA: flagellar hook-associated protein FlgK [Casimicrobiaceae bacterium]|nr:flagellar hook-associated protein FlgK [Casimicrobiaceae bacterium]
MANSIHSIGLSGLLAAQAGLATTGHNIANVNTPGFSRQETLQLPRFPLFNGGSFYGQGTDVAAVRRVYSDFLATQTLSSRTDAARLGALADGLSQLDGLFGDPSAGLSPALSEFFAGVNAVAAHPGDIPARQSMLAAANALVARFRQVDGQMSGLRVAADDEIRSTVTAINGLVDQLAGLNKRILEVSGGAAGGQAPNDLLDQRDAVVGKLNDLVGASVVVQDNGTYNVFLKSGQALVVGTDAHHLLALPDVQDPQKLQIALDLGGGNALRLRGPEVTGGRLAGVIAYRDGGLAQAQNEFGRIAAVLADAFNAQHQLGLDRNGAPGGPFFALPAPATTAALTNSGSANLAAAVANASALAASDYEARYDGATWTITRLSDGVAQSFASLPQTVDGVTFSVTSGSAAAGDAFLVQPTRFAARDLALLVADPAKIAAAAPIRTSAGTANTGTATITGGSVNAAYLASPLGAALTLAYSAGTNTLSGFPPSQPVTVTVNGVATTYAAGAPVPYASGATVAFGGIEIAISGTPVGGDTFGVTPNTNAVGDNRNAQRLAALASSSLVGGNASFGGALGLLTSQIGSATSEAQAEHEAQTTLYRQTDRAMQAVSGVNLDEEAANLQRYQRAYQAAGEVMRIAGSLFDTILDLAR